MKPPPSISPIDWQLARSLVHRIREQIDESEQALGPLDKRNLQIAQSVSRGKVEYIKGDRSE